MSEKRNINDDIIFQSFSKNFKFESNEEQNKNSPNEILEFSFKKNLFIQKTDDNNTNNHVHISSFNEHNSNIYSKNDKNILESGHFGRHESKNFKSLIEKNSSKKNPIFCIEEKYNRYSDEEKQSQNGSTLPNNSSNSSIFRKLKKIQIIRKKKSIKNNNTTIINPRVKKKKADSFASLRINNSNMSKNIYNNQICESYLYKKKLSNNNINLNNINSLNNISISNDDCYKSKNNNTVYGTINTMSITEITKHSKYDMHNIYRNNYNNFGKKLLSSKTNKLKPKIKTSLTNFASYILKNMKENKENISMNYNQYCNTVMNNNYYYPPNFNNNSKYINNNNKMNNICNNETNNRTYRNSMCAINKSYNKTVKYENIEKVKNDFKHKINKKLSNITISNNSISLIPRCKNLKQGKENKIKNYININFGNIKSNTINNKSIHLYKTITHKGILENKKGKNISCSKLAFDKTKIFKEKFTNCYGENHGIIF